MTSSCDAPELARSDSNQSERTTQPKSLSDLEEDLDVVLKFKDVGATACRAAPVFDNYSDSNEEYCRLALHLQPRAEEDSEMREPPPARRPPLLKTTRNPMATPNHFWAAIWV
jgi:hypothetical protein